MTTPQAWICGGLVLAGFLLMQWESNTARKSSLVFFCAASSLGVYFLTDRWWGGALMFMAWILFPLSELVIVVRKLRVPRSRMLEDADAPQEHEEELILLTRELQALGFRMVDECQLSQTESDQYYRLFVHEKEPTYANIACVSDEQFGFNFLTFTCLDSSGILWITWDYPLTYGLKVPPTVVLYRNLYAETAAELYESHHEFISINKVNQTSVIIDPSPKAVRERMEKTLQTQLDYNIKLGILAAETGSDDNFRYSWRGTFYVAGQVLHDLVTL